MKSGPIATTIPTKLKICLVVLSRGSRSWIWELGLRINLTSVEANVLSPLPV